MIHWLVQTTRDHPSLDQGIAPQELLSAQEAEKLASLKTEKRQRDWLLGRWTAKHLIQTVLQEKGQLAQLGQLYIGNRSGGEPFFQFLSPFNQVDYPLTLSISHSHDHAFCAVAERPFWAMGADIEHIESRHPGFVQDYFTGEEQRLVAQAQPEMVDTMVTAVWSAKEAVLKAMHLGLRADTRSVRCLVEVGGERPLSWTPFTIELDAQRLGTDPALAGWWRTFGEFVLTVAIEQA